MAESSFKLELKIGASLGQSFGNTLKGSKTQLTQLGGEINKLRSQQSALRKLEINRKGLFSAIKDFEAAKKEFSDLRRAMLQSDAPTKQIAANLEAAKNKVTRLSTALSKKKSQLDSSRSALKLAGISTRNLRNENQRLGTSVDQLSTKYKKLSLAQNARSANSARQSELRGQLFDAGALGATVAAPLSIAIGFEQSIKKLGAITRTEGEELQKLSTLARQEAERTQFTARETASAMTFLGMAGFKTNQIIGATPGVLNLAAASGSDLGRSADIASNIMSGFAIEAENFDGVADLLVKTFTTSNTTLETLGETMKFAAPVAQSVGVSIQEVAAMAGLLGKAGIQGSLAGTALRASILRLSAPPTVAGKALSELGVQVKDAEGNLRSLPQILDEIASATEFLGTADRAEAIKNIFGVEASAAATELIKLAGQEDFNNYLKSLQNVSGEASTVADKMNASTAGSLRRLGSALESVAISVGNVLLPSITAGADGFASIARFVSGLAQSFPTLTKLVVGATVGLIGLRIATLGSLFAFNFLYGGVLSLGAAYRFLGLSQFFAAVGLTKLNILTALSTVKTGLFTLAQWGLNAAFLAFPLTWIVGAIVAVGAVGFALVKNWEKITAFIGNLWTSLKENTWETMVSIADAIGLLFNPIKLLGKLWNSISGLFSGNTDINLDAKIGNQQLSSVGSSFSNVIANPQTANVDISEKLNSVRPAIQNQQTVRVDAPITVNAVDGMNSSDIAQEIKRELGNIRLRESNNANAFLFDSG